MLLDKASRYDQHQPDFLLPSLYGFLVNITLEKNTLSDWTGMLCADERIGGSRFQDHEWAAF